MTTATEVITLIEPKLMIDPNRWPDRRGKYHADCPLCHKPAKKGQTHFRITDYAYYCQVCKRGGSIYGLARDLGVDLASLNGSAQTEYDYTDKDGNLLYQVVRKYPKGFYCRRPEGAGWTTNLDGVGRVLYRLPEVASAIERGETIFIVEGERDVETLRLRDLTATTNPHGAGKWRDEYSNALRGANIVIIPDNDTAGEDHIAQVAGSLKGKANSIKPIHLPDLKEHGDVTDWLMTHTIDELLALVEATPTTVPPDAPTPSQDAPPRFVVRTEADLAELPPIRYLDRELGLVAGAFHLIYGASGSGKTFVAIERAMRQVAFGRRVLYIATEDLSGLRYRVAAWRKAHPEATGTLTWLEMPDGIDLQDHRQVAELIETIAPYQYDHIVLDTLREAHSGEENSSQDTARIDRVVQRLIQTGAAMDVLHHTGVAGERPRGSTALFGNADAVIKVDNDDGLIHVSFDKLRNAPPRDALTFGLVQQDTGLTDSDGQPVVSCILRPASQVTRRDAPITVTQRKVLEALALSIFETVGAKEQQITRTTQLNERTVYRALAALKNRGYITQHAKGDPYYITPEGRAQLGPDLTPRPTDSGVVEETLPNDLPPVTAPPIAHTTDTTDAALGRITDTADSELTRTDSQCADTPTELTDTDTTLRGVSCQSGVSQSNDVSEAPKDDPTYRNIAALNRAKPRAGAVPGAGEVIANLKELKARREGGAH